VTLGAGVVTYTPAANFVGTEAFTYTVEDGFGGSAVGTVTVNVAPTSYLSPTAVFPQANGTALVRFIGRARTEYVIQASLDGGWETLGTVKATATGTVHITDPRPAIGRQYRAFIK
jgi:hypothetical protein